VPVFSASVFDGLIQTSFMAPHIDRFFGQPAVTVAAMAFGNQFDGAIVHLE